MIKICLIFILLFATDFCILFKKDISFTLPVSGFTIALLSYLLAWTNLLSISNYIINGLILLATFVSFIVFIKSDKRKDIFLKIFSPGLFGFLLLSVIALKVSNAKFCQCDEFTHWGTIVKDMYYSKRLSIFPDSANLFKVYPPGMALWEYYFVSLSKEWNDWSVIYAYNIFIILWMMPIFNCIRFTPSTAINLANMIKKCVAVVFLAIIIFCLPYLYYSPYEAIAWRCIYIDRALAFGFAWLLFMHFGINKNEKDLFYYAAFSLGAGFQCLLKNTGISFVIMALVIVLFDIVYTENKEEKKSVLIHYGLAAFISILIFASWHVGLKIMKINNVWNVNSITLETIIKLVTGKEEQWRYETVSYFLKYLSQNSIQYYHGNIIGTVLSFPFFWLIGLFFVFIIAEDREKRSHDSILRKRITIISALIIIEFVIYEISVLLIELYVLSQSEGMIIASGTRYSADFCLGISCFIIFYIIKNICLLPGKQRFRNICFLFLFSFIGMSISTEQVFLDLFHLDRSLISSYANNDFNRYIGIEKRIQKMITPDDNCLIMSYKDLYGYHVLRKQLLPGRTKDATVDIISCEDFQSKIANNNINYVFMNKYSDEFQQNCGYMFENNMISELTLYKVVSDEHFYLQEHSSFLPSN